MVKNSNFILSLLKINGVSAEHRADPVYTFHDEQLDWIVLCYFVARIVSAETSAV